VPCSETAPFLRSGCRCDFPCDGRQCKLKFHWTWTNVGGRLCSSVLVVNAISLAMDDNANSNPIGHGLTSVALSFSMCSILGLDFSKFR